MTTRTRQGDVGHFLEPLSPNLCLLRAGICSLGHSPRLGWVWKEPGPGVGPWSGQQAGAL